MATLPHLDIPSTMRKPGPWIIQHINPLSDGQASTWGAPPYRAISSDPYRVKIGSLWAEEKGIATAGKEARLSIISKTFSVVTLACLLTLASPQLNAGILALGAKL